MIQVYSSADVGPQKKIAEHRRRPGYMSPALAHEIPGQLTPRRVVDAAQAGGLFPWHIDPARPSQGRADRRRRLPSMRM